MQGNRDRHRRSRGLWLAGASALALSTTAGGAHAQATGGDNETRRIENCPHPLSRRARSGLEGKAFGDFDGALIAAQVGQDFQTIAVRTQAAF